MRWHLLHHDPAPTERHTGGNIVGLEECARAGCHARRTTLHFFTGELLVEPGWPVPLDRHGELSTSSGWVKPPPGGWPIDSDQARFISRPTLWD